MTSVGYGEEKIRCANLKGKRVASNNNIFIGNGISDKSCINYDNSPSVEFSEDEIVSRDGPVNPNAEIIDLQSSEYQGQKASDIQAFNESFDELLEKYKSFKQACDESRLNLANRVVPSIIEILDKFNVSHDLRGPFLEGYNTHEDRKRAFDNLREKILNLFLTENVFESFLNPGGRKIHLEHQMNLRNAFNREHPNHNHSNSVITMDMIKRLVGQGHIGRAAKSMSQTESPVVNPDNFSNKIIDLSKKELDDIKKKDAASSKLSEVAFQPYEELDEFNFIGPDTADVSRIVANMNIGTAKGASGFSNKILKSFCANRDPKGLELVTYLVNFILRGWVSDKDWDLINTTRGISLDKGNFKNDANDWRPICISEPLMSIVDRYFKEGAFTILTKAAGCEDGLQLGLSSNGLHIGNKYLQGLFDLQSSCDSLKNICYLKVDVKNAFNSIFKQTIKQVLTDLDLPYPNYWNRIYSKDSKVIFNSADDDNIEELLMNRGTHQGRPSSPLIFDAVIMKWMKKNDLIDANFSESFTLSFRSVHDDMLIHGTPAEIISFYNKLIIAFNKAGLEFNKSKTKILHNVCMDESHWQVLDNFVMEDFDETDESILTEDGLIFGGLPFGTDSFINQMLYDKFKDWESDVAMMMEKGTIDNRDPGLTLAFCRFSLSARWGYWLRAIPKRLWSGKVKVKVGDNMVEEKVDILELIDSTIWKYFLRDLDIDRTRGFELSKYEENIAKCIFNLKLNNGGLGVQSVVEIADSALVGSWTCFVDDVFKQLYKIMNVNESNEGERDLKLSVLQNISIIQDIKTTAGELKNYLYVDNEYKMCDHQSHSILVDGTCPVSEMLDILCDSAGFDTYDSDPGKLIKFRGNKFMKYQKKLTHLKNVISRDHLSDSLLLQHNDKPFNNEDGNFKSYALNNDIYRSFQDRSKFSQKFLNRIHMSYNKRTLNLRDTKKILAHTLLISFKSPTLHCCKHCNTTDVSYWEHLEQCKYIYGTLQKNNGEIEVKLGSRSQELHKAIKRCCCFHFDTIADATRRGFHEPSANTFDLDPNHRSFKPGDSTGPDSRADILLNALGDSGKHEDFLIDVTVYSSHVKSNINCHFEFHKNNKYFRWVNAGVAKKAWTSKQTHYSRWLHDNHIIPFAFDSAGNIAPGTLKFINKLFAPSNSNYYRTWNSENERKILKNWFLNKLSMILAKQRVTDLNKSLAISLMERKENCRKFNIQKKNKKANAIRQRGGNVVNVN